MNVDAEHGARHRRDHGARPATAGAVIDGERVEIGRRRERCGRQVEPEAAAPHLGRHCARRRRERGYSVRNAVVVSPARTAGCATSQRRNGRFVVTPTTSVSASAAARRSNASPRFAPLAISFAIIGSYAIPTSSPSSSRALDTDRRRQPEALDACRSVAGTCADPPRTAAPRRPRRACCTSSVERLAARDSQTAMHEIDAGDGLGHGMLDLDAAIQLQEEELAAVEHELGRACADVADRASRTLSRRRSSRARRSGSSAVDGDSSSTFWWRRCTEHSRSPSESTVP